jgi:hypothetical protein
MRQRLLAQAKPVYNASCLEEKMEIISQISARPVSAGGPQGIWSQQIPGAPLTDSGPRAFPKMREGPNKGCLTGGHPK